MAQQLETKNNRVAEYEHKVEQLSQDLTTKEANLAQTKQVKNHLCGYFFCCKLQRGVQFSMEMSDGISTSTQQLIH